MANSIHVRLRFWTACLTSGVLLACAGATTSMPAKRSPAGTHELAPSVDQALALLRRSDYALAEAALLGLRASTEGKKASVRLGLAQLYHDTGRVNQAEILLRELAASAETQSAPVALLLADVLADRGELGAAREVLLAAPPGPQQREVRLRLAELEALRGARSEAESLWHGLIDDYNTGAIGFEDATDLALAGRAAAELHHPKDANALYDLAEQAGQPSLRTLRYRAELFLSAHDPSQARKVLLEAQRLAPNHPDLHVLDAQIALEEELDFGRAEREVQAALAVNPQHAGAQAVRVELALRDLDFRVADEQLARAQVAHPNSPHLRALAAASRLLRDDRAGYQRLERLALEACPDGAGFHRRVAGLVEWHHRYEQALSLLDRALELAPADSAARGQWVVALLRGGHEERGRQELERAFKVDPFDRQLHNLLDLYERRLDHELATLTTPRFVVSVPKQHAALLKELVLPWLDAAWDSLSARYGVSPPLPIRIELHADRESFGIRAAGHPDTTLAGVCFGRRIVLLLPLQEPLNLGMTLWHELSHVFHLAASNYQVPRWFTEGLAESETRWRRPEWQRETDELLWEALQSGAALGISELERRFTHAQSLLELTRAYVIATEFVDAMVTEAGFAVVPQLLAGWAQGESTVQVLPRVLGRSPLELEQLLRRSLERRTARFAGTYFPPTVPDVVTSQPPKTQLEQWHARRVLRALSDGELSAAQRALEAAGPLNSPDLLWASARLAESTEQFGLAFSKYQDLASTGHGGSRVEAKLAALAGALGRDAESQRHWSAANQADPQNVESLNALALAARKGQRVQDEQRWIEALALLDESHASVHRRRVELRLLTQPKEAWSATESLVFADPLSTRSHRLVARAALAVGQQATAKLALQRALLGVGSPEEHQLAVGELQLVRAQKSLPPWDSP